MTGFALFVIGMVIILGWIAFKLVPALWRQSSPQTREESALTQQQQEKSVPSRRPASRRVIIDEIREAEAAGGSYWVEGAAIAEKHGLTIWDVTDDYLEDANRRDAEAEAASARVKEVHADIPVTPFDLRSENGVSVGVVGTSHWVDDETLDRIGRESRELFLRREAKNAHDANAIAVYGGRRKLGYLSRAQAAKYAPLLDELGTEFLVAIDAAKDRLCFLMPRLPQLRKLVSESQPS